MSCCLLHCVCTVLIAFSAANITDDCRYNGWYAGYQVGYNTSNAKLMANNVALGYQGKDFTVHGSLYAHTHAHTHTQTCTHTHKHTHTHTHAHTYMHTHTHRHTRTLSLHFPGGYIHVSFLFQG